MNRTRQQLAIWRYNHRDREDLIQLRSDLETLSPLQRATIIQLAARHGLTRDTWPIKIVVNVFCRLLGPGVAIGRSAANLAACNPALIEASWRDLTRTMVDGHNGDDPTSAGGWNKRDLDFFLNMTRQLGWDPPADRVIADNVGPANSTPK